MYYHCYSHTNHTIPTGQFVAERTSGAYRSLSLIGATIVAATATPCAYIDSSVREQLRDAFIRGWGKFWIANTVFESIAGDMREAHRLKMQLAKMAFVSTEHGGSRLGIVVRRPVPGFSARCLVLSPPELFSLGPVRTW